MSKFLSTHSAPSSPVAIPGQVELKSLGRKATDVASRGEYALAIFVLAKLFSHRDFIYEKEVQQKILEHIWSTIINHFRARHARLNKNYRIFMSVILAENSPNLSFNFYDETYELTLELDQVADIERALCDAAELLDRMCCGDIEIYDQTLNHVIWILGPEYVR